MALAAGATVCAGRYRLEEVVGRGGMAVVWRATDVQLERTVAIKVISDVLADDPRFVARFEREARLAAGLSHPNLVKLFDFSAEDERPLLVMEFVPGGTLSDKRAEVDPVSLARELLDALAHIHGAGILHRDIKPANVLLGADGSPRLTDFGIARSEDQSTLTLTGQVLGTLRYIAPEVAEGRPATRRSDLYSLGVLLAQVAGDPPPPPLAKLLPRLTAADPEQRPASATEALAELEPTRLLERGRPGFVFDRNSRTGQLPKTAALQAPAKRIRVRIARRGVLPAALALAALIAAIVVIASGGGGEKASTTPAASNRAQTPEPAPASAPLNDQLTRLEQIVRAAPRR